MKNHTKDYNFQNMARISMNNIPNTGKANNTAGAQQHAATNAVGGSATAGVHSNRPQPPQAAANLGRQLHAESTASASPTDDLKQKKVTINLANNVCFEIPRESRTDKLVAQLTNKLSRIDRAILRNQENNLAISDAQFRQQMDGLQNEMGHLLKQHVQKLVMQLEEIGPYHLVRKDDSLMRQLHHINSTIEQFVTGAAMANNQPVHPNDPANRPPTER